ncbi:N5-glutamine methyltransferase family protein [Urbifossiella limnaea]|uniref:peptide chain release factor N(5)-glutamine methyltransferase n=1 Tax=Urbifossiella limnaea TaxID=2528023 RepID=A0A517Y303_9BACT|nr:class I SAM-dependent methyltransferase [Urbifossiella limnaea]QDU24193.1 Release factor glutamine methyltransferase [Urbifossiella limnaea]
MAERNPGSGCEVSAAYGRGRATFMGLDLLVAPGVLVPRPETELLARAAIDFLNTVLAGRPAGEAVRVVDVCCGSGNLACAIAAAVPAADVWATDLTDPCVDLTRRNVRELGLGGRVRVFQGDLYAPLVGEWLDGRVDAVLCNPPYIPTKLLDDRADLRHEPREAFDGGPFGLSVVMRALQEAPRLLRPGGRLFVEVGPREERHAVQLVERSRAYTDLVLLCTAGGTVHALHARRL